MNFLLFLYYSPDESLVVRVVTISSKSVGIGAFLPNTRTHTLQYMCNLTTGETDTFWMAAFNATAEGSTSYSAVAGLAPYTNYTATCLAFMNGVDQCYIGNGTIGTYTDSKLRSYTPTTRA